MERGTDAATPYFMVFALLSQISLAVPCPHSELICISSGPKLRWLQLPFLLSPHSSHLAAIPLASIIRHRLHFVGLTSSLLFNFFPKPADTLGVCPFAILSERSNHVPFVHISLPGCWYWVSAMSRPHHIRICACGCCLRQQLSWYTRSFLARENHTTPD